MEQINEERIRINKFLSEAGICSRREADRQIAAGNVTIEGRVAQIGDKFKTGQSIMFCGRPVLYEDEKILLVVHKPEGIVCTTQKKEKNNIVDFLDYPKRIYPVGRLDKDSSGLLLMTNQGDLVNKIMKASNMHEKEYLVTVNKDITPSFIAGMAKGVYLEELKTRTRPCQVKKINKTCFQIILTQGLNRQIRRMCAVYSYRVKTLHRVRIMNIKLGDLAPGTYRQATAKEWGKLLDILRRRPQRGVVWTEQKQSSRIRN